MKKTLFTLLMFTISSVVFTGCKKDDDKKNGSIEGTWKSTKDVYYITVNGAKEGKDEVYNYSNSEYYLLTFSGNKYTNKEFEDGKITDTDEGTYTYSNGKVVFVGDYEARVEIKGNTLVLISEEVENSRRYVLEEHFVRQ